MPDVFEPLNDRVTPIDQLADVKSEALQRVLDPAIARVEAAAQDAMKDKAALNKFLVEKLRYEVLCKKFDATGAYREEQFHIKLREHLQVRTFEFDELGLLKITPEDKNAIWFNATLPDLPLVNLKGGHDIAGNITLGTMTLAFENGLVANGGWENTDGVFHMRGADFVFNAKVDNGKTDHIYAGINEVRLPKILDTSESPKVAVSHVSMAEIIEIFNSAQLERGAQDLSNMVLNPKDVQKELSGILARVLDYNREFDKVTQLAESTLSKSVEEAEVYFNNYVKKYFEGTPFNSYETFKTSVDSHIIAAVAERAAEYVITKGSLETSGTNEVLEHIIFSKFHLGIDTLPSGQAAVPFETKSEETLKKEVEQKIKASGGLNIPNDAHDLEVVPTKPLTLHAAEYAKVKNVFLGAKAEFEKLKVGSFERGDVELIRALLAMSGLDRDIELFGHKVNFLNENLEILDQGNLREKDLEALREIIQISQERMNNYEAGHDKLTGLPNRQEYYWESNELVTEALRTGNNNVGVYFVDLAFLNYFNQKANRATGNRAIEISVKQLEDTFWKTLGPDWMRQVKIYRYGGDELAITFIGSGVDVTIKEALDTLNATGKPVEAVGKADGYIPERIQYNYGFCDLKLAAEGLKGIVKSQKVYTEEEVSRLNNYDEREFVGATLAKVMTNMGDLLVDQHKVSERFKMLMQRYTDLRAQGQNVDWDHFRDMFNFSGKALKGIDISVFESVYAKSQSQENPEYYNLFKEEMKGKGIEADTDITASLITRLSQAKRFARSRRN